MISPCGNIEDLPGTSAAPGSKPKVDYRRKRCSRQRRPPELHVIQHARATNGSGVPFNMDQSFQHAVLFNSSVAGKTSQQVWLKIRVQIVHHVIRTNAHVYENHVQAIQ